MTAFLYTEQKSVLMKIKNQLETNLRTKNNLKQNTQMKPMRMSVEALKAPTVSNIL